MSHKCPIHFYWIFNANGRFAALLDFKVDADEGLEVFFCDLFCGEMK
jgi:hypothetical protein